MESLLVSIDWDFFPWYDYDRKATVSVFPGTPKEEQVKAWLFYWQAPKQTSNEYRQYRRWARRRRTMRRFGLELETEFSIHPHRGCVTPPSFQQELGKRIELADAFLWYGDLHVHGFFTAEEARRRSQEPLRALHFDAHADLGYLRGIPRRPLVVKEEKRGEVTSDSWLYHALRRGLVEEATIVYPDWRGLQEWERIRERPSIAALASRVQVMTWSDWLASGDTGRAVGVNVARSSSFTPPWLDPCFQEFLAALPPKERRCLDCQPIHRLGSLDACLERSWPEPPPKSRRWSGRESVKIAG